MVEDCGTAMRYLVCRAGRQRGDVFIDRRHRFGSGSSVSLRFTWRFTRLRLPRVADLARHLQGRDQFTRGHVRRADGRNAFAPDRGVHHAEDQHQHRRHQVDRDRTGPARDEIAGVAQDRFGGRQRLKPDRFDPRHRQNFVRGVRERRRLCSDRTFHLADHGGLAIREIGGAAACGRRNECRGQRGRGTLDRRRDGSLLQIGDHAHQRQ
jgi:hypothetical protein